MTKGINVPSEFNEGSPIADPLKFLQDALSPDEKRRSRKLQIKAIKAVLNGYEPKIEAVEMTPGDVSGKPYIPSSHKCENGKSSK